MEKNTMKSIENPICVLQFDEIPLSSDFISKIESRNVPAVFHGCINDWEAFSKWNPSNGGLDYLQERVGSSIVEAMLSRSAPVFYGDLRSHERVPLPFSTFITCCKRLQNSDDGSRVCVDPECIELTKASADEACVASPDQVYLAQVPILNVENTEKSQLETLKQDIQMPKILEGKALTSINLWMNTAKSRSSTHYDPDNNLLCVVAGCKQVVLWPPSAVPSLYPMPIYGEASNHSSVDLEKPDFSIHSRAKHSMMCSQKVSLHAGDALFIPEGWFHQVDSDDLTIAVNFWWRSSMMSSMQEHMDAYYLRVIMRRLVNKEMDQMLYPRSMDNRNLKEDVSCQSGLQQGREESDPAFGNEYGIDQKHKAMMHEMDPITLQALHGLVSLVHDGVKVVGGSEQNHPGNAEGECRKNVAANSFCLEDDAVANVIWTLKPLQLQSVLLAMAHNFPRTLEALILHMLSPVAAEVLTRKFDEIDEQTKKEDRDEFYQTVYGVFDDQFAAMNAILNGKESFAQQAFKNVLDKYIGVNFEGLKL